MTKVIETKTCKDCGCQFDITDTDLLFYKKIAPVIKNQKYKFPYPYICPKCRIPNRMIRRNERKLYKRKCDFSGQNIISNIAPDKPYKVYKQDIRLSDKRDPTDYARDFDFSRGFFDQINELIIDVPMGVLNYDSENCDYVLYGTNNKDCYLCYCISYSRDCYHSKFVQKSQDCIDCLVVVDSRDCYECIDLNNCFDMKHSFKCNDCSNSTLLANCQGCSDCFGCWNLNNRQYCIFNKQYMKEEYKQFLDNISSEKFEEYKVKFEQKISTSIVRDLDIVQCENSFGAYLVSCKDCENCFDGFHAQNCKDSNDFGFGEYIYSCSYVGYEVKYAYEVLAAEQVYNCAFCIGCINIKNTFYSLYCTNCDHCFGCDGLNHKQYYIFNKQYSKEGYEKLVPEIIEYMKKIGEWGKFFPIDMSPFGYNETAAQEYVPLSRDEAIKKGYKWIDKEYPINIPEGMEMFEVKDIPLNIKDVYDSILNKAIICEVSGRPYRIVKPELEFYKKHGLPIPRKHPDIRHMERMKQRPGRELYIRKCDKCGVEMLSVYAENSEFKVYCEKCYNKEIYG